MPYCDWCHLESDTEDACVWCKRPFRRNLSVYGSMRDSVALLREDGSETTDRAAAVIGALVACLFLGIVIYAVATYGGTRSASGPSADPLSKIAESERTWSGERPIPPTSMPSATIQQPPPPTAQASTQGGAPSALPSQAPAASPMRSGAPVAVLGTNALDPETMGERVETGVYLSTVKMSATRQRNGNYTVEGTITVGNVSGSRAHDIEFWLITQAGRIRLKCTSTEIGSGVTQAFDVQAIDVPPEIATAANGQIQISAKSGNAKITDWLPVVG